jgi:dTDP-4-amino-4,6-dideoxygalactose transaminase
LKRLPQWTCDRIENAAYFNRNLKSVRTPPTTPGYKHVFHQYTVRTPDGLDRDAAIKRLDERGIGARVYYPIPIHKQPIFQSMGGYENISLPETDRAVQQVFSLPIYPALTPEEREYIVQEVNALC